MRYIVILLISFSLSAFAQESAYKATLDSVAKYLQYSKSDAGRPFLLGTFYKPVLYSSMAEVSDSTIFISMTQNVKTKIVFTDGSEIYMVDLKSLDTNMISPARSGVRIYDPKRKATLRKSFSSRIFNGKHGGVETEYILLNLDSSKANVTEHNMLLLFYLKQAVVLSKKVKLNKKDLRTLE